MRRLSLLSALAACGLALAGCAQSGSANDAASDQSAAMSSSSAAESAPVEDITLNVFAAASLTETFGALEKTFEAAHPNVDVVLNLAGSQDLVAQMAANGGADVLATANESTMDSAKEQGLVEELAVFVKNTLTLITPPGNPAGVTGLDSSLDNAKLVICAPEVPCGKLTKKLTAALGVELHPVSEEQAVTDVRGKVASGEADAGIVYKTDALAEGEKVETVDIQGAEQAVNTYPIAVAAGTSHADSAKAWVDLVLSAEGQKVLEAAGFTPAAR